MLFPAASLTDPIVQFAVDVIDKLGLPGIFVLMVAESACIPIPSEATMLFAGFNVANGEYSLFAVVAVGTFANVVGSWIAYAVGYYGRIDILEKHGAKLHIKPSHLAWADHWFERYGSCDRLLLAHAADHPHLHLAARRAWRGCRSGASRCSPRSAASRGSSCSPSSASRPAIAGRRWKDSLHYVDYAVAGADPARPRLPPGAAPPQPSEPPAAG